MIFNNEFKMHVLTKFLNNIKVLIQHESKIMLNNFNILQEVSFQTIKSSSISKDTLTYYFQHFQRSVQTSLTDEQTDWSTLFPEFLKYNIFFKFLTKKRKEIHFIQNSL